MPGIAAGLTQGVPAEEALSYFPAQTTPSGVEVIRNLKKTDKVAGTRVPIPRFSASVSLDSVMVEESTGRVMHDAVLAFAPETRRAIQAGSICLRCLEPQPTAFPEWCDLCGYPIRERQILDVAMEFDGEKHLGPTKPMSEFLDNQTERLEKRKFIKRVLDGGQGKIPKTWLHDATLLEGLTPEDRQAIGAL